MGAMLATMFLPVLAYCLFQTVRDLRAHAWPMAVWGGLVVAFLAWGIANLTSGPQH